MTEYEVTFSCNPDYLTPAACSTRRVRVGDWSEIPAACAEARGHARVEDVTIVRLWRVG